MLFFNHSKGTQNTPLEQEEITMTLKNMCVTIESATNCSEFHEIWSTFYRMVELGIIPFSQWEKFYNKYHDYPTQYIEAE